MESDVKLISTSAVRIHANMAESVTICSTLTPALACQAIQATTARPTSMTAPITDARTAARVSISSTITNAFVEFHTPDEIATRSWIRAHQTDAETAHVALQAQTTKTFTAHARSASLEGCAMKTSTNASFHRHHAGMERHARTSMDRINAYVPRATREKTARSIPTTARHSHARMAELAWMESETTRACAMKVSRANIARPTSMNVSRSRVRMARLVINTSTPTLALVRLVSPA